MDTYNGKNKIKKPINHRKYMLDRYYAIEYDIKNHIKHRIINMTNTSITITFN